MSNARSHVTRGFTLVEVLVAMAVFSVVIVAATGLTSAALDLRQELGRAESGWQRLQSSRAIMKADLGQLVDRPVRDAFGVKQPGGLRVSPSITTAPVLAFVRGGWINPAGAEARSSLQYVEYALEDRMLVRRSRPYLDPTPDTLITTAVLATDVDELAAFILLGGEWQPAARMATTASASLPAAIAIEIKSAELGFIRQAFQLPAP